MKSSVWFISLAMSLVLVLAGCSSSASRTSGGGKNAINSEILVRRVDSNANLRVRVFVDGRQVGTLRIGETATYKVGNGEHTIFVNSDTYADRQPNVLEFTSYQSRHVFAVTDGVITALHNSNVGFTAPNASANLDAAVQMSFETISKSMKSRTKVAIINVASDNPSEGNFVIEELTYLSVHSKKRFVVIDRRKIESIRLEKNFDRTSTYEDDFLISIGHLLGAEVILTGNLIGQGDLRRLRVKALDVKTARLLSMTSDRV